MMHSSIFFMFNAECAISMRAGGESHSVGESESAADAHVLLI
jgi:hypothetical protein